MAGEGGGGGFPVPIFRGGSWSDLFNPPKKQRHYARALHQAEDLRRSIAAENAALTRMAPRLPSVLPTVPVMAATVPLPTGSIPVPAPLPIPGLSWAQWALRVLPYVTELLDIFGRWWGRNPQQQQQAGYPWPYGWPQFPPTPGGVGGSGMPNVPATIPGDYYGTGPGIDFGDIYGPNSWACRTLGLGCGSGVGSPTVPGFPQIPGFPFPQTPEGGGMPQLPGMPQLGGCPTSPFRPGMGVSARASMFVLPNPVTGRPVWFGPYGRPMLWSGDLAACRRVSRISGKVGRWGRRRSSTRGRRRRSGGY